MSGVITRQQALANNEIYATVESVLARMHQEIVAHYRPQMVLQLDDDTGYTYLVQSDRAEIERHLRDSGWITETFTVVEQKNGADYVIYRIRIW